MERERSELSGKKSPLLNTKDPSAIIIIQVEYDKQLTEATTRYNDEVKQLQDQTTDLKQQLREAEASLRKTREELDSEQHKNTELMFSELANCMIPESTRLLSRTLS